MECYDFDRCSCALTVDLAYIDSISVCSHLIRLQICFSNLTQQFLVHFISSFQFPYCNGLHGVYRRYDKALNIVTGNNNKQGGQNLLVRDILQE